ncbi:hypothetical protein HSX11_24540 [Oxalobacteraceae bacterium]|nr:hypothetical protein [Oxalobacteraceae bacterium]
MITIRNEQLQTLSQLTFEPGAIAHVSAHFPRHVAALGPEGTRRAVRSARAAAAELGFHGEREITHYIDLTFMFGPGFHRSPLHAWAAAILADQNIADSRHRMARLYEAAIGHLRQLATIPELAQGV